MENCHPSLPGVGSSGHGEEDADSENVLFAAVICRSSRFEYQLLLRTATVKSRPIIPAIHVDFRVAAIVAVPAL
jgi:hypothetical protein